MSRFVWYDYSQRCFMLALTLAYVGALARFVYLITPSRGAIRKGIGALVCAFSCLILPFSTANASLLPARAQASDPDAMLIDVYKLIAQNKLIPAQQLADALVNAYPTFHLGHLVQGDLFLMHNYPVTTFGAVKDAPSDKLNDLRAEARMRIKSLSEKPNPELIPRAILQLRDDQKHVLVVDAKRSRLYLYENQAGKPKFVMDYYVSQGKLGVEKMKAGDQKTPLGVYYITSRLKGSKLPDFYGPGALPLNYPNDWDKVNGRSGAGIWVHGTPSDSYSRAPLASDGCLVLTNPDLQKVADTIEVGKTPVIISEHVEFVTQSRWNTERAAAMQQLESWRLDVESKNLTRWLSNYSRNFKSAQGETISTWFDKQQMDMQGIAERSIKLSDISLFYYPGKENMLVSTFTQETINGQTRAISRKRQYWVKEGTRWKIIYEGVL